MGKLTDIQCKRIVAAERPFKVFDGGGLFLLVTPSGGKLWRMKYRHGGKEGLLSFGKYPAVSLAAARAKTAAARELLERGEDPAEERKAAMVERREEVAMASLPTFAEIAGRWYTEQSPAIDTRTAARWATFIAHATHDIGKTALPDIRGAHLVQMVKRIVNEGKGETARRTFSTVARIMRWAVVHELIERNPAADVALKDFLLPEETRHFACLKEPREIGGLMRAIEDYQGSAITRLAVRLAALTFVRPGNIRAAEWSEFDAEEWRIPASKMKAKTLHITPLSRQALAVLEELRPLTGGGRYLFPSERTNDRPMSENTVNAALRRMGYTREEMTGHGFRGMASTRLHEMGFARHVVETQLAHAERNEVTAAYCHAEYLTERRKMMQQWADELDRLRMGGRVLELKAA